MLSGKFTSTNSMLQARERYFFALFRCLEAALLALWLLSPFGQRFNDFATGDALKILLLGFLLFAGLWLLFEKKYSSKAYLPISFAVDVAMFAALAWFLPSSFFNCALLFLVNLASAGLLLNRTQSLLITLSAIGVLMAYYVLSRLGINHALETVEAGQPMMYSASFAATVLFCQLLAQQANTSQALAETRGQQLLEMAQMNELIIKRMRTGVILLDRHHRIVLSNEAANQLSQHTLEVDEALQQINHELDAQLWQWRKNPNHTPSTLVLYANGPEVIPRFVSINLSDVHYLAFLEDSRVFSGRADEMQLANLGRLSASIAHEIRNPLAAISYAQQLLSETQHLAEPDQHLLNIIGNNSQRMNGIIENILKLAKREAAKPQVIDIHAFIENFLRERFSTHEAHRTLIAWHPQQDTCIGFFDVSHLYQVLTVLIDNALQFGHLPHVPAEIKIATRTEREFSMIEVIDHGPGISDKQLAHLFSPFHSTNPNGTGLGLYIAKQLADANQAQLRYEPMLGGGCRFSITLSSGHSLLT